MKLVSLGLFALLAAVCAAGYTPDWHFNSDRHSQDLHRGGDQMYHRGSGQHKQQATYPQTQRGFNKFQKYQSQQQYPGQYSQQQQYPGQQGQQHPGHHPGQHPGQHPHQAGKQQGQPKIGK